MGLFDKLLGRNKKEPKAEKCPVHSSAELYEEELFWTIIDVTLVNSDNNILKALSSMHCMIGQQCFIGRI